MCEDLVPEDTVAASASSAARAFVASGSAVLATLGKRVEDARRDRTARHARQDQGFHGAALNPQNAPPQPPTTTTTFAVGTAAPIEPPEIPPLAFPSTEPPATLAPAYPAPPFARAAEGSQTAAAADNDDGGDDASIPPPCGRLRRRRRR